MKKISMVIFGVIVLAGCTTTQQSTSVGAVAGSAVGGIIGYQSGNTATGAAIGAGVGALGGYVAGEALGQKMFCPVCGKVYDEKLKYCPDDGTELKPQAK